MQSVFTLVHYRYFLNGRIETGYWQSEKKYELIIWATNFSQEHAISRRKVGEKTNIITPSQIWVQSKLKQQLGKRTEAKSTPYKSNKNQANLSLFQGLETCRNKLSLPPSDVWQEWWIPLSISDGNHYFWSSTSSAALKYRQITSLFVLF